MEVTLTLYFGLDQEGLIDSVIQDCKLYIKSHAKGLADKAGEGHLLICYVIVFNNEYGPYNFGHVQGMKAIKLMQSHGL